MEEVEEAHEKAKYKVLEEFRVRKQEQDEERGRRRGRG